MTGIWVSLKGFEDTVGIVEEVFKIKGREGYKVRLQDWVWIYAYKDCFELIRNVKAYNIEGNVHINN